MTFSSGYSSHGPLTASTSMGSMHAMWRTVAAAAIAMSCAVGCGRCDRAVSAREDAASSPTNAAVDARWRDRTTLGFGRDILPLFNRDCPKDAPPYDDGTGLGKEEGPRRWYCNAELRPGVRRYLDIGIAPEADDRVTGYVHGYEWREGRPLPPECAKLFTDEIYEWLGAVVKNQDGVPLTGTDREAIRRYLQHPADGAVLLSTGPLAISTGRSPRCVVAVSARLSDTSWDPYFGPGARP